MRHKHAPEAERIRHRSNKWSADEDYRLRVAVEKYDYKNWKKIATEVGTKDEHACSQHWHRVLNPNIAKGKFSREELRMLTKQVVIHGEHNWCRVAEGVRGRTDTQCRARWKDVITGRGCFQRFLVYCVREVNPNMAVEFLDNENLDSMEDPMEELVCARTPQSAMSADPVVEETSISHPYEKDIDMVIGSVEDEEASILNVFVDDFIPPEVDTPLSPFGSFSHAYGVNPDVWSYSEQL